MTVEPAVRQARLVVGLYGDPGVTWSVVVRLALAEPLAAQAAQQRVLGVHAQYEHLGSAPTIERYAIEQRDVVLARLADEPYGDADPLVRVALDESGRELVVATHHGCADGLGLLGYAARVTGRDLPSSARGVPPAAEPSGFVRGSLRRLAEALVSPPLRLSTRRPTSSQGDVLLSRDLAGTAASTSLLLLAAVRAARGVAANQPPRRLPGPRPLVVALGLSRRPGTPTPPPDRDTAYARVRAHRVATVDDARQLVGEVTPEPAFPVTSVGGIGPRVTRLLSSRLGSTLLISNLGRVDQPGVTRLEFWPVPAGPAGVCVGLASTPTTTTVTVRLRRAWFPTAEAEDFADRVARELAAGGPQ